MSQHGKVSWGSLDFFSTRQSRSVSVAFDFGGHGILGHIASHGVARQETVAVVSQGWMLEVQQLYAKKDVASTCWL